MSEVILNKNIFNTEKSDYTEPSIFLGEQMGLYDSMNQHYPKLFALYKQMKNADWDENEFNFSSCAAQFNSCDPFTAELMIKTLSWQWETDSIAARSIYAITAPYITSNELNALYQEIGKNECLTGEHEVLTTTGWKRIDDITKDDKVAQWNYDDKSITFTNPDDIIVKEYSGKLYHFKNDVNNISQIVTENHRLPLVYPYKKTEYQPPKWKLASEIKLHGGNAIPTSGFIKKTGKGMSPLERLYVAVQADGSLCSEKYTGSRTGKLHYRFGFHKERKIERLKYLCKLANLELAEIKSNNKKCRNFLVYVPVESYNHLAKTFDWFNIGEISYEWAIDFLDEIKYWDGNVTKKHKRTRYISGNKSCVDKVITIAHLIGHRGHLTIIPERNGVLMPGGCLSDTKESYQVHITDREYVVGNVISKTEIDNFLGKVYCLSVPSGYFLVKHNDIISITGNCLHALTYSEIVRFSFDDPAEGILNKVLSNQDAFKRLYIASEIFNHTYEVGHKVALGLIDRNSIEAYEAIFMFIVAMYCLERIQFMASFAVTFTIANTGIFVPIGTAIQKICQDELLHAKAARTILDYELSTERGLMTFNKLKSKINNLIDEIVLSESNWNHNSLFADNTDCVGLNADQLDKWVYWNAKEVYNFFGCKPSHEQIQFPESNPLWFLDEWIEIDKVQKSPQEEKTGAYLLGGIIHNHDDLEFKIDGIY